MEKEKSPHRQRIDKINQRHSRKVILDIESL
jgi:hypothetical protein